MSESPEESPETALGTAPSGRIWLLAALLLGGLRFFRLGEWSLWLDEVLTVGDAWHPPGDGLNAHLFGFALIRWTVELFGGLPGEWNLRFLPALAGFAAVPLTAWAFRPVTGARGANLAALLMALSSWQIYWAQNARTYSLALAGSLCGVGLYLRGLSGGVNWRTALGLSLVAACGILRLQTVLLAGCLWGILMLGFTPFESARRQRRWLFPLGLGVLLLVGLWSLGFLEDYASKKAAGGWPAAQHLITSTGWYMTPLVLLAALWGAVGAWRSGDRGHVYLALMPTCGFVMLLLISLRTQVTAQYLLVMHPFVCVLAVWPLTRGNLPRSGRAALLTLLLVQLAALTALYFTRWQGERPRWREAYAFAWEQRGESELLLGMQAGVGEFYLRPGFKDVRNPELVGRANRLNTQNWKRASRGSRGVWLVIRPEFFELWPQERLVPFQRFLERDCELVERFDVPVIARDLDLLVYHRPPR